MKRVPILLRVVALVLVALSACEGSSPPAAEPGSPLPGLGSAELARFRTGEAIFHRAFTASDGLGPRFNDDSCVSCHDLPTAGGTGVERVTVATRWNEADGSCDLLEEAGGPVQRLRAIPELRAPAGPGASGVPDRANRRARLSPPVLYGVGLVEAIPDDAIVSRADPDDRSGDGVSGRVGRTRDGEVGRFGRKADHANLRDFVGRALLTEMGITTPLHPREIAFDGASPPPGSDSARDPELDRVALDHLIDYVRSLAPPPRRVPEEPGARAAAAEGEELFRATGCAECHVPEMTTGPSRIPALDRRPVRLYSDLLLHDLGPELASVCGPGASPGEWRTAILAGLRFRLELMYDGRTRRLERAIELHGGEARRARDAYRSLSRTERTALERFLGTL